MDIVSNINIVSTVSTIKIYTTNDIEKKNIITADNNICYENIKNISLKRYEINTEILNEPKDHKRIGWLIEDIQNIFPKSINTLDYSYKNSLIKDYKVLKFDQIYASIFGATQKLIQDKETLEQIIQNQTNTISTLQNQLNQVINWATAQGFTLIQ